MKFTEKDITQIANNQLNLELINQQIQLFKEGVSFINLKKEAVIGDGVLKIDDDLSEQYVSKYVSEKELKSVLSFVPASGSATRMFKFIYEFLDNYNPVKESINSYINKNNAKDLAMFFIAIKKLPFYEEVIQRAGITSKKIATDADRLQFLKTMLNDSGGYNFGNIPKGLLPFHKYKDHIATAFGEHLFESALYVSKRGVSTLHFTISEQHYKKFQSEFKRIENIISKKTNTDLWYNV